MRKRQILRKFRATTLIEVLVVIVVFLVGILAIAQIFPGGIKILNRTRNSTMALGLANAQLESLRARPDLVPDAILPISYQNVLGVYLPFDDPNKAPTEYAPPVTGITNTGIAIEAGRAWQLVSGPNAIRRVVGETHALQAPRLLSPDPAQVTAPFGTLVQVEFGPMDHFGGAPVVVNGGATSRLQVYTRDLAVRDVLNDSDLVGLRNHEFGLRNPSTSVPQLIFPSVFAGTFRVSCVFTVNNGGVFSRRSIQNVPVAIAATVQGYNVLNFAAIPGVVNPGESLGSIQVSSLRIQRLFTPILVTDPFDVSPAGDPYTYKVLNARLGTLLFNPTLFRQTEDRVGSRRLPPVAKIDYDVRDWRILHEDFRVSDSSPSDLPKVIKLAIPSLRTNTVGPIDGVPVPTHAQVLAGQDAPNAGMEDVFVVSNNQVPDANSNLADNFLVVDSASGGQLIETVAGRPAFTINKNTGNLTLLDTNPAVPGLQQRIGLVDGTVSEVVITGRTLRVYYMGKDEWAVQVARNPSRYALTYNRPQSGQFYLGATSGAIGGIPTRVYFPPSDANRRVSFGSIRYIYNGPAGQTEGVLQGVSAQVRYNNGDAALGMPSVDLLEFAPNAIGFSLGSGGGPQSTAGSVNDVRGVSVLARVFFNSDSLAFGPTPTVNLQTAFNNWARQWNITARETYLINGESTR